MMPNSLEPELRHGAAAADDHELERRPGPPPRSTREMEVPGPAPAPAGTLSGLTAQNISAWFGDHKVLDRVSLTMRAGAVTALIGPSGCGKSTFLRILNRMHELVPRRGAGRRRSCSTTSTSTIRAQRPTDVRRRIGMVFQKPNPFPAMSIYDNVAGRPEAGRHQGRRQGRPGRDLPAPGRAVERGQQPARGCRRRAVRRPAAAAVHRPGAGGAARRAADGRAVLGARPDVDQADRGDHRRARATR